MEINIFWVLHLKHLADMQYQLYVDDLISLAKYYNEKFQNSGNDLILYNQYSRLDFLKLVNWRNDEKIWVITFMVIEC